MSLTEQQIWTASKIDAKMQKLIRTGKDDVTIMVAMADHMTRFKELVDSLLPEELNQLTRKFSGFYRYAKILETLAGAIQSGAIEVPR